jgi:hypothetical protein
MGGKEMITFKELGRQGRFGNCLFQIAGTIGTAIKSHQPYAFPKFVVWDMVERFGTKEDIEVWKYLVNPLPELDETLSFQNYPYFWNYRELYLPQGNWNLSPSHFQSIKFFDHCIEKIRWYFTFKFEPEQMDRVAVHFRAGDYINDQNAYHPRCSRDYYEKAMAQFPEGTKFLIFTDDAKDAKELFSTIEGYSFKILAEYMDEDDFLKYEKPDYMADFVFMKKCKSFICANSSFSHMAALLGTHPEKKIVMPKHWFGAQANGLNFDTLYPSNAIII